MHLLNLTFFFVKMCIFKKVCQNMPLRQSPDWFFFLFNRRIRQLSMVILPSFAPLSIGKHLWCLTFTNQVLNGRCNYHRLTICHSSVSILLYQKLLGKYCAQAGGKLRTNLGLTLCRNTPTTKDIAEATAFLLSDSASYITGEVLKVNGGMYM